MGKFKKLSQGAQELNILYDAIRDKYPKDAGYITSACTYFFVGILKDIEPHDEKKRHKAWDSFITEFCEKAIQLLEDGLPARELERRLAVLIDDMDDQRKTTVLQKGLRYGKARKAFVANISAEDLSDLKLDADNENLQALVSLEDPTIDNIIELLGLENAFHLYEKHRGLTQAENKSLPHITFNGKNTEKALYPLDKVNSNVWTYLYGNKNASLSINTAKKNSKKPAFVMYDICFDELKENHPEIESNLTMFDKRVYIAASTLYNTTGNAMSYSQIYAAMGNVSRPNKRDIDRVEMSLKKMRAITVKIDNSHETSVYPKMVKFTYNGVMLPWHAIDVVVNGMRTDGMVQLFIEPPLVSFAKKRKHITTIPIEVLESPISKTDAHMRIEDYLLRQISWMKNSKGTRSNKLEYETIYEEVGIKTKMQRSRAKDGIIAYLDHYKTCNWIKDYQATKDGLNIFY